MGLKGKREHALSCEQNNEYNTIINLASCYGPQKLMCSLRFRKLLELYMMFSYNVSRDVEIDESKEKPRWTEPPES